METAKKLTLKVITPRGYKVGPLDVDQVVIPAFEGQMGILPGHVPILTTITSGILIYEDKGKMQYLAVHHGFAEILNNTVTLCVRLAEKKEEIDKDRSQISLEKSQQMLQDYFKTMAMEESSQAKFDSKIARSLTRLSL